VATSTSLVTLGVLVGLAGLPATWSNVVATAVGTVPSFELNRRWVWSSTGRRSVLGQVVPFCTLSFTGLVVSTLAVGVAASRTTGWSHWGHTAAVLGANVAAYGTLWVVQYLLLDRILFRRRAGRPAGPEPTAPAPATPAPVVLEASAQPPDFWSARYLAVPERKRCTLPAFPDASSAK
jgi:putative flippase GtrA